MEAIDFLMYSYFGIDLSDTNLDEETIIDTAIDKAYSDATNQGAFNAIVEKNQDEYIASARREASGRLKKFVEDVTSGSDEYDLLFAEACNCIKHEFAEIHVKKSGESNKEAFTFGNAQKWINMTMKNLYVICSLIDDSHNADTISFKNSVLKASRDFHVPVDSYIIEKLWGVSFLPYIGELKNGKPVYMRKLGEYNKGDVVEEYMENRVIGWSLWTEEIYNHFHGGMKDYLKDNQSEIEWECKAWIEVARKRKNKR